MTDTITRMRDYVCTDSAPARTALTYGERLMLAEFDSGMLVGLRTSDNKRERALARQAYKVYRQARGYRDNAGILTHPANQPKLEKSARYALGLMLTPARSLDHVAAGLARTVNACPRASRGCEAACLATSGHGAFDPTQQARQVRHGFLLSDPYSAGVIIGDEVLRAVRKHGRDGVTLRLNVLSDYRFELIAPRMLERLAELGVRTYDYTAWAPSDREPIHGYDLTYSAKEESHTSGSYLESLLLGGHNVALPFTTRKGEDLPSWHTFDTPRDRYSILFPVIDGDLSDDRTEDPKGDMGVIIGLRAKGRKGKADTSGFIRTPVQ